MPSVNLQITPVGPLIDAYVAVSAPRAHALQAAKQPLPQPVVARFLIDTGASNTCVDQKVIAQLSIAPTGSIQCHTPTTGGTPSTMNQYDVQLMIPCPAPPPGLAKIFAAVPVSECDLSSQGLDGLLGRDILSQGVLIYNGTTGAYTLSF